MSALELRLATPGDTEHLLELIAEFCIEDDHPFDVNMVRRALGPLLETDRYGVVWLLQAPAEGYAVITWSYSLESGGVDALLDEFYVRQRGAGWGSAMLQAVLEDLRRRDIDRIFLETETANARARHFYARNGFEIEDSVWMSADL